MTVPDSDLDDERRERPTMRDVAALAGVGLKTVSRVTNGVPTVAPELVERVRSAMDKLGYRPNLTASNLRRGDGRTNTIGLLVEDVSNPFSASLLRSVEDLAYERGVMLLGASLDENPDRERAMVRMLIDRRVDGLIIVPASRQHTYIVAEQRSGTQFVFVDRLASPLVADSIVTDNRESSAKGVAHLMAAGHRRIAYIGDSTTVMTARERYEGYQEALDGAGLALDPDLVVHGVRAVDQAREAVTALMTGDDPPTALFTSQNLVTLGATEALHHLGLHQRVALVGFDDFALAGVLDPGVTVIAQRTADMGRLAAERLFARIDGDRTPSRVFTIPSRLIPRGSGELPAEGRA